MASATSIFIVIFRGNSGVAFGIQFAMLAGDAQGKIMTQTRLYTRKWCGWCVDAKEYLKSHGIPFEEIDVGRDPAADEEMIRLSGQRYVPTVVIDGHVLANFDTGQLERFLAKLSASSK
jgi:glutaredoxin-like YruB-family protein